MTTLRTIPLLAALAAICVLTTLGQAQESKKGRAHPAAAAKDTATAALAVAVAPVVDSAAAVPADTAPKKHHGFMSRVKSVAGNKVVRSVAKVAACTMVPGGQVIAGAMDAAASKSVAGAAQGAAGVATGSSCMPGMGGAAGLAGGMPGAAGAGLGSVQLAAMQAGAAGGGGTGNQAMMAAQLIQMQQIQQMQLQQMQSQSMAAGAMTEAPGQTVALSPDVAAELTKGKTIVRGIDWIGGMPGVSPAGTPGFTQAMAQLGGVMAQVGGTYRLDLYLDNRYEDAAAKSLGAQRLATVEAALADGLGGDHRTATLELGKTKRDKNPRLEVVRKK